MRRVKGEEIIKHEDVRNVDDLLKLYLVQLSDQRQTVLDQSEFPEIPKKKKLGVDAYRD